MAQNNQLSLEQEFNLRTFANQVERMSREQAQECLVKLQRDMMIRDNLYQQILKNSWGLDGDNGFNNSDPMFA
ncbi:MAG: hypothetical protein Kow00121_31600 [Elainellaceae cyanobacterium]